MAFHCSYWQALESLKPTDHEWLDTYGDLLATCFFWAMIRVGARFSRYMHKSCQRWMNNQTPGSLIIWDRFQKKKISNCQPKTDIFPPFTTFTFNHTVDRKIPAPVDLVNIPLVCKVSYTSATVAGWLTFTLLLSQGCLDGVVFPERGQICAPKRKEWQLFHLAGLGIVFVVNFYYGKPPI